MTHEFKPYAQYPWLCAAELDSGETCNRDNYQHQLPTPGGKMIVWTVTVSQKNTAPSVHVCTDEAAAQDLAKSFREDFDAAGLKLADVAIYIQAHGLVEEEEWICEEIV